jgi:putative addiction module CopG family antidote
MSRAYVPGPKADAIVASQLEKGYYSDADDVVRVGLMLLRQSEAELAELGRLIEAERAAYDRMGEGYAGIADPEATLVPPRDGRRA